MPLIAVDIGNSSIKLAIDKPEAADFTQVFLTPNANGDELTPAKRAPVKRIEKTLEVEEKYELLNELFAFEADPCNWYVCSVDSVQTEQLRKWVQQERKLDSFHVVTADEIELESIPNRSKLGRDRLLAAWIAFLGTEKDSPVIIVDAGTAVTVDVVDVSGEFIGGLIFPGAETNLRAVSDATDALPDLTNKDFGPSENANARDVQLGESTESAILGGVHQLQIFGLIGIVEQLIDQYPGSKVVYTGGGIKSKRDHFPASWIFVDDLVLLGAAVLGRQQVGSL